MLIFDVPPEAVEDTAKRKMKEKHYNLPDGNKILIIGVGAIHFKSNGQFIEKDQFSLTYGRSKGKNAWRSNSDDFKVELDGRTVVIIKNGIEYNYSIDGLYVDNTKIASPTYGNFTKNGNEFTITNLFPNCDLKIYVDAYKFRDELIIKQNILEGTPYSSGQYIYIKYNAPLEQDILVTGQIATIKHSAFGRKTIPLYYEHIGTILKKGINVTDMYSPYDRYPIIIDPTDSFALSDSASIDYYLQAKTDDPTGDVPVGSYHWSDGKNTSQSIGRYYIRFDLSSLNNQTLNSAAYYNKVKLSGTTSNTIALYGVSTEYSPSSTAWDTLYAAKSGMGMAVTTISNTTFEAKTFTFANLAYINSHQGGYCDFVLSETGVLETNVDKQMLVKGADAPSDHYLSINYGGTSAVSNPMAFGAGF